MNIDHRERRSASGVGALVFVSAGLLIWLTQFAVVYATTTFACAVVLKPWWAAFAVVFATVTAAMAAAAYALLAAQIAPQLGLPRGRASSEGLIWTSRVVTLMALVAIVWTGSSVVFVDACAQGR